MRRRGTRMRRYNEECIRQMAVSSDTPHCATRHHIAHPITIPRPITRRQHHHLNACVAEQSRVLSPRREDGELHSAPQVFLSVKLEVCGCAI